MQSSSLVLLRSLSLIGTLLILGLSQEDSAIHTYPLPVQAVFLITAIQYLCHQLTRGN
jgi:hypothetical protein